MYIKKLNFAIYLVLALVIGFGTSFLIGNVNVESDQLTGDISKASVYSKQMPDPESTIIEELLRNDADYLEATKSDLSIIKERVEILSELTKKTIESCGKLPEFEDLMLPVSSLQAKAYNTSLAVDAATQGLEQILDGNSSPEYEVSSNNVYLGFDKINNQLEIGQSIVNVANDYIENNEKAGDIASLADEWMQYCIDNAVISDSEDALASWDEELTNLQNTKLAETSSVLKSAANVSKSAANVSKNAANVSKNAANVSKNAANVSKNAANVSKNAANVSKNAANVSKNAANVSKNAANVSKNAANVSKNAANVSKNAANVSKNAANVSK